MSLYTDSEAAQIGITIMFTIIVITNLLGNTAVCLVIILNRDMRYVMKNEIKVHVKCCSFVFGKVTYLILGKDH